MITITGNTYPVKEQLKALGGRWNSAAKGWVLPDDQAAAAQAIVNAAGPATRAPRPARSGSRYARFSSGAETYTNRRGRCEDAPCCGCCS